MKCKCGGILEITGVNEFIESGVEGRETIIMTCNLCLKDYLGIIDYISKENNLELWDCICENCGHLILEFPVKE